MCSCDVFRRWRRRPPSTLLHDKGVLRLDVAVSTELLESVQAYAEADRQSRDRRCDIGCCALARDGQPPAVAPPQITKGDNLTQQSSRHTPPEDRRPPQHHGLFRAAGQQHKDRHPAPRSIAPSAAAQPSWDVFSHASDYDVAEQQRPAAAHDEVTMRSLRLPFATEADPADAIDQLRLIPIDEDDYR